MALPVSQRRPARLPLAPAVRMWSRTQLVLLTLTSLVLIIKGVVYGSLISTQNNATGAKVFSENEQFNHMAGHKKRHEANRQHPSNLLVRCTDPSESDEECGLLVNEVIEALDRLMDFFYNNLNLLIADGFVGIAIAQGQLKQLTMQLPASPQPHLIPLIDGLILKTSQILERFDSKQHGVPEIGQGMKVLLQQEMWITSSKFHPVAAIESSADNAAASLEDQQQKQHAEFRSSDECLGQLLSGGTPCHISAECWQMQKIAPSEKFSYSTTHHLFYYHIAKKLRCKVEGRELDRLIGAACDKILRETEAIAASNFPESQRDLFLEQVALCGLQDGLGAAFVRPRWLREALKWQKTRTGCYGVGSDRVKRNEKLIPSGCLVHFSSVAAAALATSLRALLLV